MNNDNLVVWIVIACEILQTLLIMIGIVQITKTANDVGHLTQRQTFLENVVGDPNGFRGSRSIPSPRAS